MPSLSSPKRSYAMITLASAIALLIMMLTPAQSPAAFKFGMQANNTLLVADPGKSEEAMDDLDDANVQVVRLTLSWNRVAGNAAACTSATASQLSNHNHACYDWTTYDALISSAERHGILVLASIYQVPQWVNGNSSPYYVGSSSRAFKRTSSLMAAFSSAAATRYKPGSTIGRVHYYTVGNEPNSAHFWRPMNSSAPQRFAYMYTQSAKAIRKADPRATIAAGPTGPKGSIPPASFIRQTVPHMAKYGARGYLDAWAHNPYPGSNRGPRYGTRGNGILRTHNLDELFRALDSQSLTKRKPVWATEFSYQTNPPDRIGVSQATQATFLADIFDILHSNRRVQLAFWYVFRDNTTPTDWQSGIRDASGRNKSSYAMWNRPVSRTTVGRVDGRRQAVIADRVSRGATVRVWGASLAAPGTQSLQYSTDGQTFRRLPNGRNRGSGVSTGTVTAVRTFWVRVEDSRGTGPALRVTVR